MGAVSEYRGKPVRELGESLPDGDRTLLIGAPGIEKSKYLDELNTAGEVSVVRTVDDMLGLDPGDGLPVVLDNFYNLFSRYCRCETERKREFEEYLEAQLAAGTSLAICTTPYRLRWILQERMEVFERLLGDVMEWTVVPVYVDSSTAEVFLQRELPVGVEWTRDQLDETKWEYPLSERLNECIDGSADKPLNGTTTYWTYLPSTLADAGPDADIDEILQEQSSVRNTLREMVSDVIKSEGQEGSKRFLDGVRAFSDALREEGWNALREEVEGMLSTPLDATLGGALAASSAAVPVASMAYWAYATRRARNATSEAVRTEFQSMFSRDMMQLPAAEREEVEEDIGVAPGMLENLNRVASGISLDRLERTVENVGRAHDRIDDLETTVEDYEAIVRGIEDILERRTRRIKTYQTVGEFELDQPDRPAYEPPEYEIVDSPASANTEEVISNRGETVKKDPRDTLENILTREDEAIVLLTGESGIGKTRLMLEVAERMREDGEPVRFVVEHPPDEVEPRTAGETTLFLDEVGRKSNPEYFLSLASRGRSRTDDTIQVVAAVRPVYEETTIDSRMLPESVPQYEINLGSLDSEQTSDLLSGTGIDPELAVKIHDATEGNPGLSRLLARPDDDSTDDGDSIERRFAEIVDETILEEASLLDEDTDIELLLTLVAFLKEYDIDTIGNELSDTFSNLPGPYGQEKLLRSLAETAYLRESDNRAVAHRFDVLAEYLRYRDLVDRDGEVYRWLPDQCLSTEATGIARGLAELRMSTLRRFDFIDDEALVDTVDAEVESVATDVLDSDAPLADVFEVQAVIALFSPQAVPHKDLVERHDETDQSSVRTAWGLAALFSRLYRHASRTHKIEVRETEASDIPSSGSEMLFKHARTWVNRLDTLHETTDDPEVTLRFAKGLVNAINHEGEDNLDEVRDNLDRLDTLHETTDDPEVTVEFAKGLVNAINHEGEADNLDEVRDNLDRLDTLHETTDDPEVTVTFATGLVNAINHEGEADNLDEVRDNLDRLDTLHETADDPEVTVIFAKGLVNTINHEEEKQNIHDRINTLANLAGTYPEHHRISSIATFGHLRVLEHSIYEDAGGDAIGALDDLAESVDTLRLGTKSDIAQETLEEITEHLIRVGQLDQFKRLADVLRAGLSAGRWATVSANISMEVTDLHVRGELSTGEYQQVMSVLD